MRTYVSFPSSRTIRLTIKLFIWTFLLITAIGLILGRYLSDPIAAYIYANAFGPDDRELPPTVGNFPQSAQDIQIIGGLGNGFSCSLPAGFDWLAFPRPDNVAPISLQVRQACIHHDLCYRHGEATYGYTQADCDYLLQEKAFRICTQIYGRKTSIANCEDEARKVTLGVRLGGSGSFLRANAPANRSREDTENVADSRSVYHEFDHYPTRSEGYQSVRIADAPRRWIDEGSVRKAYYAFHIRPSGIRLRILAVRKNGGPHFCAVLELAAKHSAIAGPPMIVSVPLPAAPPGAREAREDWFVWWRRRSTTSTDGVFSGIAPQRAALSDWAKVFGYARIERADCSDDIETSATAGYDAGQATFQDLPADPLVSEFYPALRGSDGKPFELELLGISTHGCGGFEKPAADTASGKPERVVDQSPCLTQVKIDTRETPLSARIEPFRALNPDCFSDRTGTGACDRYRHFALPPFPTPSDVAPGMATLYRGAADGSGYQSDAILRWSTQRTRGKGASGPRNYRTIHLPGLSEEHEPVAWSRLDKDGNVNLLSAKTSAACGDDIELSRFAFKPGTEGEGTGQLPSVACLDLHKSWLNRPWRLIGGETMVFLHLSLRGDDRRDLSARDWRARVVVKLAMVDALQSPSAPAPKGERTPRRIGASVQSFDEAAIFGLCAANKSDAPWRLVDHPRENAGCNNRSTFGRVGKREDTETPQSLLERAALAKRRTANPPVPDLDEAERVALAAISRQPVVVGDIDDDSLPEVALFIAQGGDDVVVLRSRESARREQRRLEWSQMP